MQKQLQGAFSRNPGYLNVLRNGLRDNIAALSDYATQAVKVESETTRLVKAIQREDLSITQAYASRKKFNSILREQFQIQKAMAVQWTRNASGTMSADVIVPRGVDERLNRITSSLKENIKEYAESRKALALAAKGSNEAAVAYDRLSMAQSVLHTRMAMTTALMKSAGEQMVNWGKNTQWAGRQLMVGFTIPYAAFAATAAVMANQVDQQMTRIRKVYDVSAASAKDSTARAQELGKVTTDSLQMATAAAKTYGVSIQDTLDIEAELAATGKKGNDLMESTVQVTKAMVLGELDKQSAIKATIALQSVYGHSSQQLSADFNYMTAIANATSLSMQDFVDAIPRGAGVMKNLGVGLRELAPLLVAMKQAGIGAAEGMNGLRSAAQRILTITPQAEGIWHNLLPDAGSLQSIVEMNKGQFIPTLMAMGKAMEKLEPYQKQQIISKVFGIYQSNKIFSVLDGLLNRTNQVGKAYEIMANQAGDADVAQRTLEEATTSVSARIKREIRGLQAELVKMGQPLLEMGTTVIGWLSSLASWFNSFPDKAKNVALITGAIVAIIGPAIMLVGLFGNLIGQGMKFLAMLAGWRNKTKLLTVEQQTEAMLAKKNSLLWQSEAKQAQLLAFQLGKLSKEFQRLANAQAMLDAGGTMAMAGGAVNGLTGRPRAPQRPTMLAAPVYNAPSRRPLSEFTGINLVPSNFGSGYRVASGSVNAAGEKLRAGFASQAIIAEYQAAIAKMNEINSRAAHAATVAYQNELRQVEAANTAAMEKYQAQLRAFSAARKAQLEAQNAMQAAADEAEAARQAEIMAAQEGGWKRGFAKYGLGIAAVTTGILGLTGATDGWVNVLMNGAFIVTSMGGLFGGLTKKMLDMTKVSELWAGVKGAGGFVNKLKAAGPLIAALGMSGAGFAAVLAGAGIAAWKIHQAIADSVKAQREATQSAEAWSKVLNFAYTKASEVKDANGETKKTVNGQVEALKENNAALVEQLQHLKAINDEEGLIALARKQGLQVIQHGGDAAAAEQAVKLSLRAAGLTDQQVIEIMPRIKVDWTNAEAVLEASVNDFKDTFDKIVNNKFDQSGAETFIRFFASDNGELNQIAADQAKVLADEFFNSWDKATAEGRLNMWKSFTGMAGAQEQQVMNSFGKETLDALKQAGLGDFKSISQMLSDNMSMTSYDFSQKYTKDQLNAFNRLDKAQRDRLKLVTDSEEIIAKEFARENNVSEENIKNIHTLSDVTKYLSQATMTQADAQSAWNDWLEQGIDRGKNYSEAVKLQHLNTLRLAAGMTEATSSAQGFGDAEKAVGDSAEAAAHQAEDLAKTAQDTAKAWAGAARQMYSAVQNDAFNQAEKIFNDETDKQVQAISDRADARTNALDAAAEKQNKVFDRKAKANDAMFDQRSKALDERWYNIETNFKYRWEDRIAAEKKAYDDKIDRIKKEVSAEEKADKIRQAIFEAEKNRLERLAAMQNANIDINVALSTGHFDEAAKLGNDIMAQQQQWAIADAQANSGDASQARKDALNAQADALSAERDKRIESLQRVQDAEKHALDLKKEREQEALNAEKQRYADALEAEKERYQKSIEAQKAAIKKQADADVKAKKEERARIAQEIEWELAAIRAATPRNEAELKDQISRIEKVYGKYGEDLKGYGENWTQIIGRGLQSHIAEAAAGLADDIKWDQIAADITNKLTTGSFGMSPQDFMKWATTGELPAGLAKKYGVISSLTGDSGQHGPFASGYKFHDGGAIGGISGGVSGTHSRLPQEYDARLLRGEYVMNRQAVNHYGPDMMDAINNRKLGVGGKGGSLGGLVGVFAAGITGIMRAALNGIVARKGMQAMSQFASVQGGQPGQYGDSVLDTEQLSNAATIMNVGRSMGASQRDLVIGLMTALQESGLRNINYGDRDSVGLFQQRPSQGWGSVSQILDPSYAARKFFQQLLRVDGRDGMPLWAAAQAVQRSGFPMAYAKWEDEARAIIAGSQAIPMGGGGWRAPVNGIQINRSYAAHPAPKGVDLGGNIGDPIYSAGAGIVSTSTDLLGSSPYNNLGYRSYGRYIVVDHGGGLSTLYAHMSNRYAVPGQRVGAGSLIGALGTTGNSTGPHLHFEMKRNGANFDPHGMIPGLDVGGFTLNDGYAKLHRNETVLTAPLSSQLKSGIQKIDQGVNNEYSIVLDMRYSTINSDVDVEKAVYKAIDKKESKLGRNRTIR